LAFQAMKEMGFTSASDITGGDNAWHEQGLPLVT
jgi:rhodanese-related sulfurtransferase